MPTPRPLAFALLVALVAGSAAPDSLAAKKPAAKKKAPAVAVACSDFHAEANKAWLASNPIPPSGAISALGQLTARAQQQQRELLDASMQSPQGNVQKLLGDFWASGLDEAAVEPTAPTRSRRC
jgi:putative endopeptidase